MSNSINSQYIFRLVVDALKYLMVLEDAFSPREFRETSLFASLARRHLQRLFEKCPGRKTLR